MSFNLKLSKRHKRRLLSKQVKNLISDCTPGTSYNENPDFNLPSTSTNTCIASSFIEEPKGVVAESNYDSESECILDSDSEPEYKLDSDSEPEDNLYSNLEIETQALDNPMREEPLVPEEHVENQSCFFLGSWALKNNITHNALTELLHWFSTKPNIENLPRCARTLLNTPRHTAIVLMGQGEFYYYGIEKNLIQVYKKYEKETETHNLLYILDFNIDGLPLHKSTKKSFWPILCKVCNYSEEPPFVVALYCGLGKPPLQEFFSNFITEVKHLHENAINFGPVTISIKCRSFCCDTPARSYIRAVLGHNSYQGCDRCYVQGVFINKRMVFLDSNAQLRTDLDFRNQEAGNYHKDVSPLCELNDVDMVLSFPVDYMHLVCLGVVRKLLFQWRDGSRLYRLSPEKKNLLEEKLHLIKKFQPIEFNRKPRSLNDLEHWKATELRQFLLYVSPLLGDVLASHIFANIMLLKYALTILLSQTLNSLYNDYASKLLKLFVSNSIRIYGRDFCVYNVHALIHLAKDAQLYNTLNTVNSFTFENYLGFLKRMLRKSHQCLQQIIHRATEGTNINVVRINNTISVVGKPFNSCARTNSLLFKTFFQRISFFHKNGR